MFSGRAAVITGASSGLGRAIAIALGETGLEQWLVGRSVEQLAATAGEVRHAGGGPTHCVALDLAERGSISGLIEQVGQKRPHLFSVINCAGVMFPEPILSADPERWATMFEINVIALLESCQAAVKVMRRHGRPARIINVSSSAGRVEGRGAYSASKAAVDMIGRTLKRELEKDEIRITTVVPGPFQTNLARDFLPETLEAMAVAAQANGIVPDSAEARRYLGDPRHVGGAVRYVLEQPTEISIDEIVVQPPARFAY